VHSLSRLCTSIHPLRLLSAFIPSVHHDHLNPSIAPLYLLRYSTADPLNSLSTFRADPPIVHVGHYGQPTVTEAVGPLLRSVDRSVRLGRLGFCPECLMAEVGKRLDYNEVRTTERWINTQGESACQALKREGRKGLYKVFQPKRMRCRDSTKYAREDV
jgi:hypothetical protein